MNALIAWFARNPVAANLLMLLIVAGGLVATPILSQEIFPEIKMGVIRVAVVYPGASPVEVEEAVCVRIEEEIHDLEGVKRVTASAREGLGTVVAELDVRADARKVLDEIKARLDAIDDFPDEAEAPIVQELESFKNVIDLAIFGDVGESTLVELGKRVRDEIADLHDVSHVELANVRPYEISIEVPEATLRRHGLRFDEVVQAVRRSSLDLPGGTLKSRNGEILMRTRAQARRGPEFERLVLLTRADGTRLELGDVAHVVDGFADTGDAARFDGKPAVLVQVYRAGDERVLDVVAAVKAYVAAARPRMPEGAEIAVWRDESVPLRIRRDIMLENGVYGLVLVLLVLSFFLRPRFAFWVSMGIPISFLGAIAMMPLMDVSVNTISLVGFIVALGLVVDDAIVVGDAVGRREEAGQSRTEAAIGGTRAVALPVVIAALTSVVMLVPIFFVGGVGQQGRPLPAVVIACLVFSLIEALLVLPAHLAHGGRETQAARGLVRAWERIQQRVSSGFERCVADVYRPCLELALRERAVALAAAAACIALCFGLVAGSWVPFTFLPQVEGDYVTAVLTMPEGTPAERMDRLLARVEDAAGTVGSELDAEGAAPGQSIFRHVFASQGSQPEKRRLSFFAALSWNSYSSPNLAEVQIALVPRDERSVSAAQVAERWRALVGEIPEAVELSFPVALYSTGDPINVQLAGAEADELAAAGRALGAALANYPGVRDVTDTARRGKRELRLSIRPEAEALGISAADLARQVRQGFHGEEVQRAQRGRDDVPVVVRYPAAARRSLEDLDETLFRTPAGVEMPFAAVAVAELEPGIATLQRADRKRTLRVVADVDPVRANANAVVASLEASVLPRILADHPGVSYTLEGHQREQADFLDTIQRGYLLGLLAVYALLAIPLRSYTKPLLILLAVPFAGVGAIAGHGLMGIDITMFTLVGLVGVTGVVVNDTLVLLHAVDANLEAGLDVRQALVRAGVARFRPIVLTTLTTFLGLTPLLLEGSSHAQDLKPMAVAIAFGELFSTAMVLLVVPAAYLGLEELRAREPRSSLRKRSSSGPLTTSGVAQRGST